MQTLDYDLLVEISLWNVTKFALAEMIRGNVVWKDSGPKGFKFHFRLDVYYHTKIGRAVIKMMMDIWLILTITLVSYLSGIKRSWKCDSAWWYNLHFKVDSLNCAVRFKSRCGKIKTQTANTGWIHYRKQSWATQVSEWTTTNTSKSV